MHFFDFGMAFRGKCPLFGKVEYQLAFKDSSAGALK